MGITSRLRDIRPPLPAPTESLDGGTSGPETDVATNVTTRTDVSAFEIPEDGSPITIPTSRILGKKEGASKGGSRDKSQTSLLIEYFETSGSGDNTKSKPTIRVKVNQSSKKRSTSGTNDAIQITGIGKDRKPSYTQRISLGSSRNAQVGALELAEESQGRSFENSKHPLEIEVLDQSASELSTQSRGLMYAPVDSNISSMPPDSMLEGSEPQRSRSFDQDDDVTVKNDGYLSKPAEERSRSKSKERIAQKVMEKLNQRGALPLQSGKSRSEQRLGREYDADGYSRGSEVSNNPKLLGMVEDTIKRIILPEIQAVKEDQRSSRNPRSAEGSRRGSLLDDGLTRRVSKSSSTPNITNKPKVVLNKDGDEPGTVLSRGDSERKMRKSSRGSYSDERPKSKRSNHSLRDAGAASLGAGILTAAALRQHDSQGDVQERRKRRNKSRGSRSRSTGATETGEYRAREDVPPMPMASHINDSEITRESIVSIGTEQASSPVISGDVRTPVREISRDSRGNLRSSPLSSRTPTRTPVSKGLGMSQGNTSIDSPKSPGGGISTRERREIYSRHVDADGYGDSPPLQRKVSSPVQSVSSLKKNFEEDALLSKESRPRSAASRSSAGRSREQSADKHNMGSGASSPLARSANASQDIVGDGDDAPVDSPGTPNRGESADEWYERQHRLNNQYRRSFEVDSPERESFEAAQNRDSYQTNPYPQDEKRWTMFTDDSQADNSMNDSTKQDLQLLGANPEFVHSPYGAESAVASLVDQSTLSASPTKASHGDRMSAHLRELGRDSPPMYQGSTLSQTMPSQDRWTAIKAHARTQSASASRDDVRGSESPQPRQSKSTQRSFDGEPQLGASSLPVADDPIPEIGHFDESRSNDRSNPSRSRDLSATKSPSIVKEPLGGYEAGKDAWPYTPDPASPSQRYRNNRDSRSLKSGRSNDDGLLAAAAAGTGAMAAAGYAKHRATVEDDAEDRELTPDGRRRGVVADRGATPTSPAVFRDEGYATDAQARSAGSLTPEAEQRNFSRKEVDDFNRAMDAYDAKDDDTLTPETKRARHISGNSHGMASPLYDSSTGKGIDRIQSKDIVALMDHLTVRDAQRNARDTEILVTLVRSTTEMRESFDEMKRFIAEQDRMIMQNTERSGDSTAQRVLGGPRPIPARSPNATGFASEEDIQRKRKNVLRRALEGLTGGKSANDLAKVEGMLMQILDNVVDLKQQGGQRGDPQGSFNNLATLDDYEKLRNVPDPGYEPDGRADTASTPSQSGHFPTPPRNEKQQYHSGYDGRRGSANRVSTVLEGDEDDTDQFGNHFSANEYENGERLLTPTQETYGRRGLSSAQTPPQRVSGFSGGQGSPTPRSGDRQRKHQSNSSSIFGVPKISRWSKTTASSAAPDPATLDSPNIALRNQKASSEASRSGSSLARYQDEEYELQDDDRLRSTQSLVREQGQAETRSIKSQSSKLTRTPSPLIPSEASSMHREVYDDNVREDSPVQEDLDHEFDDPKYQAVRNSILLQHPQPRQGSTPRHQNTLESQAHQFDDTDRTSSDLSQRTLSDFDPAMWGSSGTAGLAKHRLSQLEPLSPVSMSSPAGYRGSRVGKDEAPLVPQQKPYLPSKARYEAPEPEPEPEYEPDWEPQYSNSGFGRGGGYYSSPFGSGHLLEPIEEVRYSLETDSGRMSPEPETATARAVNMRSTARKITGPRPMEPKVVDTTGTVRRKKVGAY